jgi:hypothetical protein
MGTDLGFTLLIGLGAFKGTQLWKELMGRYGWYQPAWWKTLLSLAISLTLALTVIIHRSIGIKVLVSLGAAGIAALLHALDTCLRSYRDKNVTDVLGRNRVRNLR